MALGRSTPTGRPQLRGLRRPLEPEVLVAPDGAESRGTVSTVAWIIVLIVAIPVIALLVWTVIGASFVRVPSGSLGLLMVKGRATDTALLPGPHFVPALRRKMVEIYPVSRVDLSGGRSAGR